MTTKEKVSTIATPARASVSPTVAAKVGTTPRPSVAAKKIAKKTAKTTAKEAAHPAVKATGKQEVAKPVKEKKLKVVRDSFNIPKVEFSALGELKLRAAKLATSAKKGELLRAGIKALAAMADSEFLEALKAVPVTKTGRPSKG
jgi:hypothetical protein